MRPKCLAVVLLWLLRISPATLLTDSPSCLKFQNLTLTHTAPGISRSVGSSLPQCSVAVQAARELTMILGNYSGTAHYCLSAVGSASLESTALRESSTTTQLYDNREAHVSHKVTVVLSACTLLAHY